MIAYAITDPSTLDFNELERDLERFSQHASMIVYRDTENSNYAECARLFMASVKSYKKGFQKVLLHSDYLLAKVLNADGVHLKSTQFSLISKAKDLGLFVFVSTHTVEEALEAEALGADMVTMSPIFHTPNKGLPMGVDVLKSIVMQTNIPVIALGGIITKEQIDICRKTGAKGFASIRYFSKGSL
ncbi:MAG: thiamine phosphate synthase [Epsilonproteobacteria bacterium]|nr:MAG: thiamine phosphate synthase [Campylobacterota bacterium]